MTDLQQPRTTLSGSKGKRGRFNLELPPPAAHVSFKPEMVGQRYGWVTIISPEKRWTPTWNHCYVLTRCEGCGTIQWQFLDNLMRGISKGCKTCSQPRQIPRWLDRRLTSAKQRCENPRDPEYPNYGGRGIRFRFPSVLEAGLYLQKMYGTLDRKMEVDRIDTNGHYEPGNVRLATRAENQANKRTTVLSEFRQEYWPYCYQTTIRKLSQGLSREEIIRDAETAVFEKRKNWRQILIRLEFMTYEMPDSITVLPYRGGSSTTAGTGAA